LDRVYPVRYDDAQYDGLEKAAKRFGVTGRQKAQRQINQLYMAFFGIIHDPIAAASMSALIDRRRGRARRKRRAPSEEGAGT